LIIIIYVEVPGIQTLCISHLGPFERSLRYLERREEESLRININTTCSFVGINRYYSMYFNVSEENLSWVGLKPVSIKKRQVSKNTRKKKISL
jgi:hypothetical protein